MTFTISVIPESLWDLCEYITKHSTLSRVTGYLGELGFMKI